jgi:hypothetical protein
MRVSAVAPLLVLLCACGGQNQGGREEVTFAHATDPHLFEDSAETGQADSVARRHREKLDREAFTTFLKSIRSPAEADTPSFLVITGDFGIGYAWDPGDTTSAPGKKPQHERERARQIDTTAALLGASPIRDIYVVPGNNDVPGQGASAAALASTGRFFDSVQARLDKAAKPVNLHNLAACYARDDAPASACVADPAGTDIRLIGFPSYSFRNYGPGAYAANRAAQEKQVEKFAGLVARGSAEGKKILVLSHIPALDDPFQLARGRYAGLKPDTTGNSARPTWSAWNVSPKVFESWKKAIESPSVVGVLAGHFHDSRREIYYPPYRWSTASALLPEPSKVFLAPPLAVRLQDRSPLQARGFEHLTLSGGELKRRLYWLDSDRSTFDADSETASTAASTGWLSGPLSEVRALGAQFEPLDKWTLQMIALLASFLTIVHIWRITGPRSKLAAASSGGTNTTPTTPAPEDSETPFTNKFGKAVIAGLSGLAAVALIGGLASQEKAKAFYVVLFILLFFVMLLGSALLQGIGEALRSRIAVEFRGPRRPEVWPKDPKKATFEWIHYHARYVWAWLFSFKSTLMVSLDAFINVIIGKNRLESSVYADEIYELQWSLVRVADRVREEVTSSVQRALAEKCRELVFDDTVARVGISVLSRDETSLLYISKSRRSLRNAFDQRSVAWVAVSKGIPLWWKSDYMKHAGDITLFEGPPRMLLSEYFQPRGAPDYEAFIVLPVPWFRRGVSEDLRRGGIHISFKKAQYFEALFGALDQKEGEGDASWMKPAYSLGQHLLEEVEKAGDPCAPPSSPPTGSPPPAQPLTASRCADVQLRAVLRQSIEIIGELLHRFNETVLTSSRRPA